MFFSFPMQSGVAHVYLTERLWHLKQEHLIKRGFLLGGEILSWVAVWLEQMS